jgi:hypothetical protein
LPQAALLSAPSTLSRSEPLSLVDRVEANTRAVLAAYSVLYAFGFWVSASLKPFWFDEIFTFQLAQLPHIGDIWRALEQGIELNPPLLFWMTWILHKAFGGGPVVTRLPAAIGFWVMTICLYHFVRRRTRPVYGLFAALFPLLTFAAEFRLEARSYGLLLGFAGLALLCWQCAADRVCRRLALLGLALSLAGAVSCHYYATYMIGALLAGELVRTYFRRRIDSFCILAIASGALPLLAFRRLLTAVARGSQHFWMHSPSVPVLSECYAGMVTAVLVVGLPFLLYAAIRPSPDRRPASLAGGLRIWEAVAAGVLAVMPLAIFTAAFFIHLGFFNKYAIVAVPGFAILLIHTLYRLTNGSARVAAFLFRTGAWTCLLPWCIWQAVTIMGAPPLSKSPSLRMVAPPRKDLPVVIADENAFLEDWFYRSSHRNQQFVALIDYQAAAKYTDNDTAQRSVAQGRRWWPIPAIDYGEFVSQHNEFLLARVAVYVDWIAQKLIADGADLRLIGIQREPGLWAPEIQIFLVKVRPRDPR